jgi:hypothetical protein
MILLCISTPLRLHRVLKKAELMMDALSLIILLGRPMKNAQRERKSSAARLLVSPCFLQGIATIYPVSLHTIVNT